MGWDEGADAVFGKNVTPPPSSLQPRSPIALPTLSAAEFERYLIGPESDWVLLSSEEQERLRARKDKNKSEKCAFCGKKAESKGCVGGICVTESGRLHQMDI